MVDARCTRAPLGCDEGWIRLTNVYDPASGKEPPYIDHNLTASPDGKRLAFVCRTEKATPAEGALGNYDIYALDIDACRQTSGGCIPAQFARLTTDPHRDLDPAWSPDGNLIAFVSERESRWAPDVFSGSLLFTMRPDGSAQQPLLDEEALGFPTSMKNPAWSPDGKTLIFVATNPPVGQHFIYTVNWDGSDLHPLTKVVPTPVGAKMSPKEPSWWVGYGRPYWSPDGKAIVYWGPTYDSRGPHMMDADGSNSRPAPVFGSWSPDGRQVVYTAAQESDGINSLFVVNADGSNPLRLTSKRYVYGPIWVR
jgi:Tol biopolymer transport system component